MIRILNAEPLGYCDEARAILTELGEVIEAPLTRAELLPALAGCHVLIVRLGHDIDREVIDAGPLLLAIVTAATGLDHVDVEHAAGRGVQVLSLRGETQFLQTIHATAEHTWALLLALLRRIPPAAAAVRRGEWNRDRFRGSELAGRRLALVGLGRVGRQVARYGLAFDMTVAAYDPYAREWPDGVGRTETLEGLAGGADVLSIHVPLTAETRGLIGPRELAALPPGAVLVNTARGEVVDSRALLGALGGGRLAGAALDVLPDERSGRGGSRASPLLEYARAHDTLLVTPHIGGATHESMARTEVFMARKLATFLHRRAARAETASGPPPRGRV